MKKILLTATFNLALLFVSAQTAYIVPKEADINQEITLYVNLADPGCNCPNLVNTAADVYFWTWKPSDPKVGNGTWNSSNEDLKMTNEGNNLFSIKFKPGEFYNITDIEAFYNDNIHGLVKLKEGGSGGGTDKENKSVDLVAEIDPLPGCVDKFCPFPKSFNQDDYFTLRYNNALEEKETMQDLKAGEAYLFARCLADGVLYEVSSFGNVGSNPNLEMQYEGNGMFTMTFIPEEFFPIPAGAQITQLWFVVRKKDFVNLGDRTDGNAIIKCGCP
jgi:hypothetical protein